MDERDEAQERARRRVWTVAVRVVDGALCARVIGQLQASGETELAAEAGWNAADVSVTDDAALGQSLERATVLLTDDISLAHAALAAGVARSCPPTSVEAFWSQRSRPLREGFLCWSRVFSHESCTKVRGPSTRRDCPCNLRWN